MPSVNIYLTDDEFLFLGSKGKPSTIGAEYLKERIAKEKIIKRGN